MNIAAVKRALLAAALSCTKPRWIYSTLKSYLNKRVVTIAGICLIGTYCAIRYCRPYPVIQVNVSVKVLSQQMTEAGGPGGHGNSS